MPLMICSACGASNRPTARFSEECGLSGLPCCGACAQAAWCLLDTGDAAGSLGFLDRGDRVAEAAAHLSTPPATSRPA